MSVPYAKLETLFLDAGNTLICMNFDWIAEVLRTIGVDTNAEYVRRAEAAARPATSARIAGARGNDDYDLFTFHLTGLLTGLQCADGADLRGAACTPSTLGVSAAPRAQVAGDWAWASIAQGLAARIKAPGQDYRLWSWVLPGVPEALHELRALGLKLVVVSNSDGSVARALEELGLGEHLDAVLDSHVVGFEKPDPRFFEHALRVSGSAPQSTAHVGDMYYQDVCGSRAAGLHSVLLDPFGDWAVDDCVRCRDLAELAGRIAAARRTRSRHGT